MSDPRVLWMSPPQNDLHVQLYTELRSALERERQARRDAEAAAGAKDDFLAMVAHELRQPLSACGAAVSLMKVTDDRETNARARGVLDRQVSRMARLVDDLLDASRIVRGRVALNLTRIDVRDVVRQAVETASPLIRDRAHTLRLEVPAEPCWVCSDASRLEQVVVNLLSNAAKYTQPGGDIQVSLRISDTTIGVHVRDTGEGIESDKLSRIFDLFTRGSRGSEGGFGIGLSVARRLVEQHGGTLRAISDGPGQGSEFIVQLPRVPAADEPCLAAS